MYLHWKVQIVQKRLNLIASKGAYIENLVIFKSEMLVLWSLIGS